MLWAYLLAGPLEQVYCRSKRGSKRCTAILPEFSYPSVPKTSALI